MFVRFDDMILQFRDQTESLPDRPLLEIAQLRGIDEIIRDAARLDLAELVVDPQHHDELERMLQFVGIFADDRMPGAERLDAFERRRLPHPLLESEEPHDVHERRDAFYLEVQFILVLAALLDHEGLEEPDGGLVLDRNVRQVSEENLLVPEDRGEVFPQRVAQCQLSVHGPEIEEDQGVEDRVGGGLCHPRRKVLLPDLERLAPLGIAGHIVRRAHGEPAAQKAFLDTGRELRRSSVLPLPPAPAFRGPGK